MIFSRLVLGIVRSACRTVSMVMIVAVFILSSISYSIHGFAARINCFMRFYYVFGLIKVSYVYIHYMGYL